MLIIIMIVCYLGYQKCFFVLSMSKDMFGKTAVKVFIHCSHPQGVWTGNKLYDWSCFDQMPLSSNPVLLFWNKYISLNSLLSYDELFPREIFNAWYK